jgi:CheY-like chemotaxis protein
MNDLVWWVLAGAIVCAIAAVLGYRAYARAALKRQAERHAAEDAARLQAQRRAAAQEAARVEASKRAEAEAARAKAQAQRLVDARRAAEFAKAEAVRAAAAQAAAKAAAERHAAEEAARARVAAAAAAAREAARLAAERAAAIAPPPPPPAPIAPAPLPPIVLTPPPPRRKAREQTLVMVADDSKIVRVKTGRLLEQHRYRVSYATDGLDAAQQLKSNTPDVVITDVEMPGMDGFELTRQVRGNPGTAHIPVIMITAAEDRHRDDAQRAGVSMLLGKPYPEDELIAHIRRAMNDDAGV